MTESNHDEASQPATPTESFVQAPPAATEVSPISERPTVIAAPPPAAEAHASPHEGAEVPPAAPPPPPPAPSSPPPDAAEKKPLEKWARLKGCHEWMPATPPIDPATKMEVFVRNPSDEVHFYAGALAKWNWVPSMEVTEKEFDEEVLRAKHGVVMGPWPHPKTVVAKVTAAFATLLALHGKPAAPHMAALPDVVTSIQDGGLGIVPPAASNAAAVIGSCSGGTVATVYAFNDPATCASTLGSGPAVELAAYMLSQPGHGTVYVVPSTCSTAGACGGTTYVRASGGPSVGTIVGSGAAFDAYSFVITITLGESTVAGGGGTFTYSADGGNTTSAQIAIPTGGTYVVPNTGVTLTFAGSATAFITGDVATFSTTAPYYSGSDFTTAFNALKANPVTWRFLVAAGAASSATNAATFASTLQSLMSGLEAANRYAHSMVQSNDTDANNTSAFASFAGNRVSVAAGQCWITSQLTGRIYTRDAIWAAAARIATRPVSEDAGRVATGALLGVSKLLRDENATPALDALRFITLRTIVGKQGFYITDGWTMAPTGSDFALLQNRFVMDVACTAARGAELNFLNDTIRVNGASVSAPLVPGGVYELDAQRIETEVNTAVRSALNIGQSNGKMPAGDASGSSVVVNRAVNIIGTSQLPITVRVVPNGYSKFISNNIGLQNPAIQLPI
jgi:hypothetical protein